MQLVGVSAMLLASKYEETYAPEVGDFVYITDNSYTKGQIKKMEQLIFKTVNFDLSQPLCLQFLRRNSKAAMVSSTIYSTVCFVSFTGVLTLREFLLMEKSAVQSSTIIKVSSIEIF